MSLQQIENTVHQYRDTELQANFSTVVSDIKTILLLNRPSDERYYINHTGRELFRKLNNFGMTTELSSIGDDYDYGFRPQTVTGKKS